LGLGADAGAGRLASLHPGPLVDTEYGWTWVSQEPWGWATYHYGRWMMDPEYGWLWVPGTEWAPAWVSFQQGDGYIGWAPLPPSVGFGASFGIQLGGLSLSLNLDPYAYSFVPERDFLQESVATVILPPARNVTFIHNSRNITHFERRNNRIINRGIPEQRIEQVTGRPVRRFRLNEMRTPSGSRREQVQGDQVSLFRPAVTLAQPKPNNTPPVVIQRRRQLAQQRQGVQPVPQVQPVQPGRPDQAPQPVPSQRQGRQGRPAPSQAEIDRKYQTEQQQLQARQEAQRNRLQQLRQQPENTDQQGRNNANAQAAAAQRQAEERALQEQNQREQRLLQARHQREQQAAQARPQQQDRPQQVRPRQQGQQNNQQNPPRETKQRKEREQQRAREQEQQPPPPPA